MIPIPGNVVAWLIKNRHIVGVIILLIMLGVIWKNQINRAFDDGKAEAKQEQKEIDHAANERRKAVAPATSYSVSCSLRAGTF